MTQTTVFMSIDGPSSRHANAQMLSLDTEIESYKKSITQEEEQNECLTLCLNRGQTDCTTSRKLITNSQNLQEVLQAQFSTYTRILQETEKTLSTLHGVLNSHQSIAEIFHQTYVSWLMGTGLKLIYVICFSFSPFKNLEMHQSALKALRKQMEKVSAVRLDLENQIMNKLQEQLTHNNAAKYSRRLNDKTAVYRREKVGCHQLT